MKYLEAFMDMTVRFAQTSEAERLKVGACLIKNGNPICFGTNGTPPGWSTNQCEDEHGNTHSFVLHAERNCLDKLRKINETSKGGIMMITHSPCIYCAHELLAAEISDVLYRYEYRSQDGVEFLKNNGVSVWTI